MGRLGTRTLQGHPIFGYVVGVMALALSAGAAMSGCDGGETTTGTGAGNTGGGSSSSGDGAGGGYTGYACGKRAIGATRGSAIALTPDDSRLVAVNRDVGTVTVMDVVYGDDDLPTMTVVDELDVGEEPWQVAIDGCGTRAYVVLRKEQKVVVIEDLDKKPKVGKSIKVGSEPTSLALTPNNTRLYVANWVDGTLSVIDPASLEVSETVDLNKTIAASGVLGNNVTARPSLAHPRAIAITNNGNGNDEDEQVLVTEWFAGRTGPETIATADTNWKGLLYKLDVGSKDASFVDLPSVADTGFKDHTGGTTGCFPNQIASVTVEGDFAYVTSTCASPKGPLGVFTGTLVAGDCDVVTNTSTKCGLTAAGTPQACTQGAPPKCVPNPINVKTTTHPAVSIVPLKGGLATTTVLDKKFEDKGSTRMPLLPTDLTFFNGFAYLTAEGADGVFRLVVSNGTITDVGASGKNFIDMRKPPDPANPSNTTVRLPIGIAANHGQKAFSFVVNEGTRDVNAVDFGTQALAGNGSTDFRIAPASALPPGGSPEESALIGKRFFVTGLGRWSLNGAAWGSCAACHIDGFSDNVTWYFNRGPRQTVSLEGSFASKNPNDQRIFNWTGIFDEVADFEANTRGVSGGVGAIVHTLSSPPVNTDRIDTAVEVPQQQGLQGSSKNIATPNAAATDHPHSLIADWIHIEDWIKTIRSPRKPTNLDRDDVEKGRDIFHDTAVANCVGCHSGAKWTISTRFWTPNDDLNDATGGVAPSLSTEDWFAAGVNGFPAALFPVANPAVNPTRMRQGAPPGAEQMQCILRPVGTIAKDVNGLVIGVSAPDVNVLELRQDMVTAGQGSEDTGRGFNPPSLLGMQTGAPYFHAGNARTLEELFDDALFSAHHRSPIAQVFNPTPTQVRQLVAYLLAIDEDEPDVPIPAKGAKGGDLCFSP
jgi:YVTN family beta-propeller protein